MCKYEMDPMSIVEDTERTRFCPQTDRRTDGQGDTSILPFQLRWSGGYNEYPDMNIRHWFKYKRLLFDFQIFQSFVTTCSGVWSLLENTSLHDDVIKWKHFPRYWPFVRGIQRSPVNSPHKGQWPGALMFSLICVWINGWVNNREAGDLRRYRAHCDVTVMDGLHACK